MNQGNFRVADKTARLLSAMLMLFITHLVFADGPIISDRAALADLKTGKGVFLIDIADAKKLNFYLEVIQGTHKGMKTQGVEPDFVLVYIGPSVKYLTTSPAEAAEQAAAGVLLDIESNVAKLASLGVRQEICAVATRVFKIDNDTLVPGLTLVADGFVSLIGYQAQEYHLVPVF
jgi:intracellular sulfur oxidation DsrE/DsrF family protein